MCKLKMAGHVDYVAMHILDLPDEVLNKILDYYLDSICFRDWANRLVVDEEPGRRFYAACELLLP